ncbi:MAG TPA: hypothetical protein VNC50_02070, partial [Planctomycetia bacterium]|nr:hypothetical protein [Planctomycetia bacterium]
LPHNVYAAFPFLAEMYHLAGMHLAGDWFLGGVAGQAYLWTFAVMGAVATGALTANLFGLRAGWIAFFLYATTPWIFRLAAIPYVEGATLYYLAAGLLAARLGQQAVGGAAFVAGAMAGCAASCKYTNILMVVPPLAVLTIAATGRQSWLRATLAFGLGAALMFGPWLARNAVWTGNPVYPLAYSVFGGSNWSAEKAAKFAAGHRSTHFDWPSLQRYLIEIPLESDWQSGLVFAFVPLVLLATGRKKVAAWLCLLVVYEFFCFWIGTHRLDRFWLPLLVPAIALSAEGLANARGWLGWIAAALIAAPYVYNLAYATTGACAPNQYGIAIEGHRRIAEVANSGLQALANAKARGEGVLYVGYSGVYYANHPAFYSTVFDDNLLEHWGSSPANLKAELAKRNIGWVAVDATWIERYRSPGSYGFTPFVTPEKFAEFEKAGVLQREFAEGPYTLYRVRKDGP